MFKDKLNLASQSPRRRELIQVLFNNVKSLSLSFDEPRWKSGIKASSYITHCVKAKWSAALKEFPEIIKKDFLLVADTIVVLEGEVLGKPSDVADARSMLRALSGREHQVLSAFKLGRVGESKCAFKIVHTEVRFLPLSARSIAEYVATGEPMDKAGSYGLQGLGMKFIQSVNGPYANVMGLPIAEVARAAQELGIK